MYRDPVQWQFIRQEVLINQKSQRRVALENGLGRNTISKMIAYEEPQERKRIPFSHPKLNRHIPTINRLIMETYITRPYYHISVKEIYEHLKSKENSTVSYSTVRDYVRHFRNNNLKQERTSLDIWEHTRDTVTTLNPRNGKIFLRSLSERDSRVLSKIEAQKFMKETKLYAHELAEKQRNTSKKESAEKWLNAIVFGKITSRKISQEIGEFDDLQALLSMVRSEKRLVRNRALVIIAARKGISARATHRIIGTSRKSISKYLNIYKEQGVEGLLVRKPPSNRKYDCESLKQAVFSLLHEPPSLYGLNRTTWRMEDFSKILAKNGYPACRDVIRKITKNAGYRWRKARLVLTSHDPEYREKLERIQLILSNLKPQGSFFSIDEFGPFSVKRRQGRKLVAPGEIYTVPQWQKSKGSLIVTAALELSRNQVTHFYSKKKNTNEMIKMMDILVKKYSQQNTIYLSWDAASWHISKRLYQHIENHNSRVRGNCGPQVYTAPLPAGAQFLNVIESVFSGMARAVIHNSDYRSVKDTKKAIDEYFAERNRYFIRKPRRAGKKIWGGERETPEFSCSNNCKDPRYLW